MDAGKVGGDGLRRSSVEPSTTTIGGRSGSAQVLNDEPTFSGCLIEASVPLPVPTTARR